ncbi:MAG: hypothetical protein LBD93_02010 [Treponema sp.]|jgi:hypothetical protein|nr:hypothetical protein [Treponema sp.]
MDCTKIKIKQDSDNRKYKNWDRHARVIALLQLKHKTITKMAKEIDEYIPLVSACLGYTWQAKSSYRRENSAFS